MLIIGVRCGLAGVPLRTIATFSAIHTFTRPRRSNEHHHHRSLSQSLLVKRCHQAYIFTLELNVDYHVQERCVSGCSALLFLFDNCFNNRTSVNPNRQVYALSISSALKDHSHLVTPLLNGPKVISHRLQNKASLDLASSPQVVLMVSAATNATNIKLECDNRNGKETNPDDEVRGFTAHALYSPGSVMYQ